MKKSMHWGSWIVVSFVLFAIGTFVMVYISMNTRVDLVTDDYYEQELKYQDHIDVVSKTNALLQNVTLAVSASSVDIRFPNVGRQSEYSGTVFFFRPSDRRGDFTKEVSIDSAYTQSIPLNGLQSGLWRIKISWQVNEQKYYSEHPVIIQ